MNVHLSFTKGNNPEQDKKKQIEETEKIRCDFENTLTIENYKIQQQERLRALEVSSRAQANWDKTTITISSSAIGLIYLLKGENIILSTIHFRISLILWAAVVSCVMISFLAGATLHREYANKIAHQQNGDEKQAAKSDEEANKMDKIVKYCNNAAFLLFLFALASTVYLSFEAISNSHARTANQQQTNEKVEQGINHT
ncbi:MAG: hypothetical protein LUC42_05505 [Akkermansia sp.]|uniref:hypothetical protein n=1 Tax=Akkermansia sp. TaxID=1872421 RepID=UPI00258423B5|nr:hypothetical protein [Akkermansia sp.]MCD8247097.1 hypothetical protein [Akkermansia sp.]